MGVGIALLTHGEPISFMALLGTVAMTGVVLNNAIVMVDFVNRLRGKGMGLHAALIEGAGVRVRPIVASSLTTLLCLFPTAYGWGGQEPFVQPMALAMAWGLMFATPLTLFVIPLCYALQDDLKGFVSVRLARFRPADALPSPSRKSRVRRR
jgi:multidrug efflux pump subunit AcrB